MVAQPSSPIYRPHSFMGALVIESVAIPIHFRKSFYPKFVSKELFSVSLKECSGLLLKHSLAFS